MRRRHSWVYGVALAIVVGGALLRLDPAPDSPPDPHAVRPPRKTHSGAMQALDLWAAQRAYPNPVIPDVGQALAHAQTRVMRTAASGSSPAFDEGVPPWTSIGPTNIGGRTLSLGIRPDNPDILFAGSASGGLWISTTGGVGTDAWDRVETGFPVQAVGAIAIDPGNPDVMYIGTGEVYRYQNSTGGDVDRTTRGSYGIGILKSIDGGVTWFKSLDWSLAQTRGVWSIRIHPTDPDIVYATTTEGVYKSVDAGGSWTRVHAVVMATDLRIHPTSPETVFVASGNFGSPGHGLYRTVDGGTNWTRLTAGLPNQWTGKAMIEIAPSSPNVVLASIANTFAGYGLYVSTNTGDSWSRISLVDFQQWQGWYSHWVLSHATNHNIVYVGGIEISKSQNLGGNFQLLSDYTTLYLGTPPPEGPAGGPQYAHADHHFALRHPTDPNTIFFASDGGVFKTTNGGASFVSLNGGYVTTQFYQGFSTSSLTADLAIGGLQDNLTAIYEGSPAWRRVIGGDGSWTGIHPQNDNTLYGSAQVLQMFRSYDHGTTWSEITPPNQSGDVTAFIAPFRLAPSAPLRMYAGRARIYRSDNGGSIWNATNGNQTLDGNNPVFSIAISETDFDLVFAATTPNSTRGKIFRSRNGGATWEDVTGDLPDRYFSDLALDPTNDRNVYVTLMGFGSSHIYRSIDQGDTWLDMGAGLPDVPASAVVVDPDHPTVVYVGTDLGVYMTPYYGLGWYPYMNGMPPALVNDLVISAPARKLRAATHGNGVYERDLVELAITGLPGDPPAAAPSVGLRVAPNPLRASTRIRFTLPEAAAVQLTLFDVSGREVTRLVDGMQGAGDHEIPFSPTGLAQGVYFLRLATPAGAEVTRVVYLR